MGPETVNKNRDSNFYGPYAGRDLYITMFQDTEREFVVTHNANIKPVSYFAGRETELQELRQRIEEGRKSVLVSGMGGIGKTHICRKLFEEYLNKHAEDGSGPFKHIGYIEYSGDMDSSLQNCLKFKQQEAPEQNREAAWRELEYLAADGKLLLFMDNVNVTVKDDPGLERLKQLPGAIVLTSRRTAFSNEFEQLRIGFLDKEQCKEIYEKIRFEDSGIGVKEEEVPDLEYIIEELAAKHTITVEHLAHLARANGWSVKNLRDQLERKGFQLEYVDDEEKLVNIQESYEVLYDLSELTEAEQNILEAFSVFPYIPLEKEICNQWLLADAGVSEEENVLFRLYRKGWLQFDIEQGSYALHPVFAQFIYEKCRPEAGKHSRLIDACEESLEIPGSGSPLKCQRYLPFAENIAKKLNMGEDIGQIGFICSIAYLLYYVSEYKKAEELYEKSLRISKRILGKRHLNTATSYNNLAGVYRSQGKYREAEELYKKSLRISKRILGKGHPNTAISYNNLAGVYESQGEYGKAEKLYEKSLRIRERVLGEEHPDTAISYNNLAGVYESRGEYGKAEELYEKSLCIREKVLGEEHPDTALGYNNLALVYRSQRKYREAEELHKKSLRIRERVLGEWHLDTALSYNNLALVYADQGKYREAEELYEKSLQIKERILGEEHPDTALSYNNLAGVYRHQGKYREAEELYERSLRIRERVLGEKHPDTALSYNNLAGLYKSQREYKIALTYYLNSYKVLVFRLGRNHPHTQLIYENMKKAYCEWSTEGDFEHWIDEKMKEED